MKKLLSIGFVLVLSLGLTACEDSSSADKEDKVVEKVSKENLGKEMTKGIEDLSKKLEVGELSQEEVEKDMIKAVDNSNVVKTELARQKEDMPKLVKVLKASRKCLADVDNADDAKECEKGTLEMVKKEGIEYLYGADESDGEEWDQAKKEDLLGEMDDGIIEMEKMMPCLEKAEAFTDMMKCSEERGN